MILIQGSYIKVKSYFTKLLKGSFFEFFLPYVDEHETFREINRFNDESRRLTRFKNKYTGKVVLNLTDWADKPLNCYFTAFSYFIMDRLYEYGKDNVILICEKTCSPEFIEELESHFDCTIEIEDVGVKCNKPARVIGFVPYTNKETSNNLKEA